MTGKNIGELIRDIKLAVRQDSTLRRNITLFSRNSHL